MVAAKAEAVNPTARPTAIITETKFLIVGILLASQGSEPEPPVVELIAPHFVPNVVLTRQGVRRSHPSAFVLRNLYCCH
jgi:hypothetical protein